jgi:hypothetical protein
MFLFSEGNVPGIVLIQLLAHYIHPLQMLAANFFPQLPGLFEIFVIQHTSSRVVDCCSLATFVSATQAETSGNVNALQM